MLRLVGSLDPDRYQPRLYVWAATDAHSQDKMQKLEASFGTTRPSPAPAPSSPQSFYVRVLAQLKLPLFTQVEWGRRVRP